MSPAKKKIVFIINPVSGLGRQKKAEAAIRKYLDLSLFSYKIEYTHYAHHAVEIARDASMKGNDIVIAIGGDGSANDVACGLVNSETVMGLIPVGSGNGLARHLKIPISLKKSIEIINKQKISRIDTATLNDKLFISIAGLGFDALIAEEFAKCSKRGFWSYIKTGFKQFKNYKHLTYNIRFDEKEISRTALLVSFANSDQFGYNARIAPTATINDGFIDLCIIKPVSFFGAALMAPKLFHKKLDTSKHVEFYKITEAKITVSENVSCHIDGDPVERMNSVHLKIFPQSLNLIVP
jgi:diacylglycerol kinase (ATP)